LHSSPTFELPTESRTHLYILCEESIFCSITYCTLEQELEMTFINCQVHLHLVNSYQVLADKLLVLCAWQFLYVHPACMDCLLIFPTHKPHSIAPGKWAGHKEQLIIWSLEMWLKTAFELLGVQVVALSVWRTHIPSPHHLYLKQMAWEFVQCTSQFIVSQNQTGPLFLVIVMAHHIKC